MHLISYLDPKVDSDERDEARDDGERLELVGLDHDQDEEGGNEAGGHEADLEDQPGQQERGAAGRGRMNWRG